MNKKNSVTLDIWLPLVSIIIPVFNVESFLRRCLDSVINQTYKNIDIILINDGSTDNSSQICDEYANLDERIKVCHKKNGGLSSARNKGMELAKGEYICFLDSDDWIEIDTIHYCVNLLREKKVDVVQFGIFRTDGNIEPKKQKENISYIEGKEILNSLMINSTKSDSYYAAGRCLYSRKVIDDLLFPIGRINEDIAWKFEVLQKAESMIDSNIIKYFYFKNTDSITSGGLKKRDFDLYIAAEEIRELTAFEDFGKIKKMGEVKYARTSLSLLCKIAYFGISDTKIDRKSTIKQLVRELRSNAFLLLSAPLPVSRKILVVMFCMNYKMTEFAVKIFKKTISR